MGRRRNIDGIQECELDKFGVSIEYLKCEDIPTEEDGFSTQVEMVARHALAQHDECIIVTEIIDDGRFFDGGGTKILRELVENSEGIPVYVIANIDSSADFNDKGIAKILKNAGFEKDIDINDDLDDDEPRVFVNEADFD